ncbi:hypothetical protein KNP65_03715 [Latilactobacillus curvatus]|uniref:MobP2 family relaxase n=1 Tax=Latilactobacillus curvatus TaxID=28038 RepID=UPI002411691F|nr:MobP2 family relaxase [Latilactobacillus curvatus]MDG2979045.1 hypothetical protein [Latilactobacillus curvatus]
MAGMPGVIETVRFIRPGAKGFQGFIDYMDRDEAVRNEHFNEYSAYSPVNYDDSLTAVERNQDSEFKKFNDYMGNPYKTDALFSAYSDQLSLEDRQKMKSYFTQAQDAKSPLWQIVYSFDNNWLVDHEMLNPKTNELDTKKIYAATRESINKLEEKSGLKGQWTGAVHYNTDNIHVHVGYVERNPTREWIHYQDKQKRALSGWQFKGSLKKNDIKASKAKFVNQLLELEPQLTKSQNLMKEILHDAGKNGSEFFNQQYKDVTAALIEKLPANRSKWAYGHAEKNGFKNELDKLSNLYLNTQQPKQLEQLKNSLRPISQEYERAYGNPNNKPTYEQNKLYGKDGLYYKFGNSILKILKEEVPEQVTQYNAKNISPAEAERLTGQSQSPGTQAKPNDPLKNVPVIINEIDLAAQAVEQELKNFQTARPKFEKTIQQVIERPAFNNETQNNQLNSKTNVDHERPGHRLPPNLNQQLNQASDQEVTAEKKNHSNQVQRQRAALVDRRAMISKQGSQNNTMYSMRRIVGMLTGNLGAVQAEITSQQRKRSMEKAQN